MDTAFIFGRSHLVDVNSLQFKPRELPQEYLDEMQSPTWSRSGRRENLGFVCFSPIKGRGAYGIRTRDLLNAIEALYQLS